MNTGKVPQTADIEDSFKILPIAVIESSEQTPPGGLGDKHDPLFNNATLLLRIKNPQPST